MMFHVSIELKTDFTPNYKECGVYFFITHRVIVSVHKIPFFFVICAVDSLNYSCFMWMQYARVSCVFSYCIE